MALVVAALEIVALPGAPKVAYAVPPSCPEGANQCVVVTPPGCTASCPSVTVGPTAAVADGAYIYTQLSNFPAGDWASIEFCPASQSTSADPICANAPNGIAGITFVSAVSKVLPDGSDLLSYQVTSDPPGQGNEAIPGLDVDGNQTAAPFYCDNSPANGCDLEITDLGQGSGGIRPVTFPPFTTANTMVVPLVFAAASAGCPSTDPIVDTEGSFSIEQFLPSAVEATCADPSTGVIGLNIAIDSESVVSDFASGVAHLVFTDDPNDPAEQAALKGSQYVLIPVAASASVVSFLSASVLNSESTPSPESTYELTPNMVAGMLTAAYTSSYGSDLLVPPLTCKQVGCGKNTGLASSFNLLNAVPSGSTGPSSLLSGFSSVATGASDETTSWLCSMPNVAVPVKNTKGKTIPVVDQNVAATTLTTPGVNVNPWPFPSCTSYPVIPTLGKDEGDYGPAQTPAGQAKNIRTQWGGNLGEGPVPGLTGPNSAAGFGAMDWGDAAYFGLNAASLLNASGDFVAPSQSSIDAALNDATQLPNGTLAYDYTTTDPNAYPTPMVTYALLSTAPQPHDQVVAETDLLTNLVNFSHSPSGAVPLPAGYIPLPDNMYAQATNEIQTALTSIPAPPPTPLQTTTGSTSVGSTGATSGPSAPPLETSAPTLSPGTLASTGLGSSVHVQQFGARGTSKSGSGVGPVVKSKPPNPGFVPHIISLLAGRDRWILPLLLGAMILCLPSGSLVLVVTTLRRRWARRKSAVTEPAT
ncbi:MAG TPA: hypothetical protein VN796_08875 [Acidimicrobiales bacterium]|nr:hypothetical protein [Acidimicrobiales bacterium]